MTPPAEAALRRLLASHNVELKVGRRVEPRSSARTVAPPATAAWWYCCGRLLLPAAAGRESLMSLYQLLSVLTCIFHSRYRFSIQSVTAAAAGIASAFDAAATNGTAAAATPLGPMLNYPNSIFNCVTDTRVQSMEVSLSC